jgi:hypothetical protein
MLSAWASILNYCQAFLEVRTFVQNDSGMLTGSITNN